MGAQEVNANVHDAGILADMKKTVDDVLSAGHDDNIFNQLRSSVTYKVDLVLKPDIDVFRDFVSENFPEEVLPIVQAQVVYTTTAAFVPVSGTPGRNVSADSLESFAKTAAKTPGEIPFEPELEMIEPAITEAGVQGAADYANARLGLVINYIKDGAVAYTLPPESIVNMIVFTPNVETGTVEATIDASSAKDLVKATLDSRRLDRFVLLNDDGTELVSFNEGHDGLIVTNGDELVEETAAALAEVRNADLPVTMNVDPVQIVTDQSEHWMDLNLSTQTATMMKGDIAVQSFLISSGVPGHWTPTGEFEVWTKNVNQTMKGEDYDIPNVKWNTYFAGDCAFHTAYWHNNFGVPMSHGCINMREYDAYLVYLWAPIGTPVSSHY
jgi:lipoprotein-anchoring transpeptidase ErfK/SrfK